MAIVSYSFAVSLDGFIATKDGSVDWLNPYFGPLDSPYEHETYFKSVSVVVMGRKTYEKALNFGQYPYPGKLGFVVTKNKTYQVNEPGVEVLTQDICTQISKFKQEHDGKIWLVGGGELASYFQENNLIDEIVMSVIPVSIGTGIRWIADSSFEATWKLTGHYTSDKGIVQVVYSRATRYM